MSWKLKEGHGCSFPLIQVRKAMGGWGGGGVVACRILLSSPVPVPLLWHLDSGLRILDFGPGFGT